MAEETPEIPVIAGIGLTFSECTFVIQITPDDFTALVRTLIDEGVLTPRAAEQLLKKEDGDD
jgi:hypothetical protein